MSPIEWSYLAGLIDGEGTIGLANLKKSLGRKPCIKISSTTPELLNWLVPKLGGYVSKSKSKNIKWADSYKWTITGVNALNALKQVQPFLKCNTKVERCKLIVGQWKPVYKASSWQEKVEAANLELEFMKLMDKGKDLVYSSLVYEVYPEYVKRDVAP